jgi:pimeloyl-ACP methyl ester carboxylesterase
MRQNVAFTSLPRGRAFRYSHRDMRLHALIATAVGLGAGCAGARQAERAGRTDEVSAPLDAELAGVPGARAFTMTDVEYGGRIYVVAVEPRGGTTAPTLVLVHGLGAAGVRDFYPVLPALARGRRVVAFDLPGFGRSTAANERYTPARYAAVVARVVEHFGGAPIDLLGHSMGGAIALMFAGTYPAQVRRLVLVDAAGILHREAWFGHHLRRVTDPAGLLLPAAVDQLNQLVATVFSTTRALEPLPEIVLLTPALRAQLLEGDPGRIAALSLILTDFSSAIAAVVAPTLVVWGADDNVAPPRTGELLSERLPLAGYAVFDGVGHDVMAEAPARLVAAVEPYLGAPSVAVRGATPAVSSRGAASCVGQNDVRFSGVYDEVVLDRCERASFERVSMRRLVLRDSSARVVGSRVAAGIALERSHLLVTGGRVEGPIALDLADSDADLAGVELGGRDAIYRLTGASKAIFSVCPTRAAARLGHLHGVVEATGPVIEGGLP